MIFGERHLAKAEHDLWTHQTRFGTTCWSLVLAAGQTKSPDSQEAMASLCRSYWYPIYAYIRQRGRRPEDAEDRTQGFFEELIEKHLIRAADPQRGRFRWYLLGAVKYYLSHELDRNNALKRGGGKRRASINTSGAEDRYSAELTHDLTAEKLFDQRWALMMIEIAFEELRSQCEGDGKSRVFDQLRQFLRGDSPKDSYAAVAAHLEMSEAAIKVAVHRLRKDFQTILRAKISQTVATPDELESEIRDLFAVLARE